MMHENDLYDQKLVKIIAVGGGKGGVGKTVVSASIGVGLAMAGKRVVLVDADFGASDLHAVMGINKPDKTYFNFYNRDFKKLDDILLDHPAHENLKLICGSMGSLGIANMSAIQKRKFIRHLLKLDTDLIVLDLGAGATYNVLDLFLLAHYSIVVVTPDPLSILDSYNFVKQALLRQFANIIRNHQGAPSLIRKIALSNPSRSTSTISDLIKNIKQRDLNLGNEIEESLGRFSPLILINRYTEARDKDNVLAIQIAARDLLSVDMDYLGAIHQDDTVRRSVNEMVPFIAYDPKCQASRDLSDILVHKILETGWMKALRRKRSIRKKLKQRSLMNKDVVICTIRCQYWEDCGFRNGGFPCDLQHLSGIQGFSGD